MKSEKKFEPPAPPPDLDPRHLDSHLHIRLLDELYNGRTLGKVMLRKNQRRITGDGHAPEPVVLQRLGSLRSRRSSRRRAFVRAGFLPGVAGVGIGRCHRLFEFRAGPGYIGCSLLANGFCEALTLADINPNAVAAARRTAAYNRIEDRVHVFQSDGLAEIPHDERWDLVVSNPPHFLQHDPSDTDIRAIDPGWSIHQKFYSSIGQFLASGGRVVMMENRYGSSAADFEPMIQAGGGKIVANHMGKSLAGVEDGLYYLVSQW